MLTSAEIKKVDLVSMDRPYNPTRVRLSLLGDSICPAVPTSTPPVKSPSSASTTIFDTPTLFPNSIWVVDRPTSTRWTFPSIVPPRSNVHRVVKTARPKTIRSFNARLNSFAQKGNYHEVLSLIEAAQNGSIDVHGPLNTYSYTILVKAYCNAGNLTAAQLLLEDMATFPISQRPNRFTYNTLLNACVRWDAMDKAKELFAVMEGADDEDLRPDHVTYTTLMKGFAVSGEMEAAEQLLHRLQNHPDPECRPNQVTLNTMLKGFAAIGNMTAADRIISQMWSSSTCPPDIVSLNTVIGGHARQGAMSMAKHYFQRMSASSIEPNSVTYHALIEGYARNGDMDAAEALFRQAQNVASPLTYQAMIGMYLRNGNLTEADRLFQVGVNDQPSQATCTMMITAYADSGDLAKAEQVIQRLKSDTSSNVRLSAGMYDALVAGYVSAGRTELAEKTLVDREAVQSRTSFHLLMEEFQSTGQTRKVDGLLTLMSVHKDPACRPNQSTYQITRLSRS